MIITIACFAVSVNSPETALYETSYVTVHKAPCRVAVFHKNGIAHVIPTCV